VSPIEIRGAAFSWPPLPMLSNLPALPAGD
jgi:hypothetical protein